MKIGIDLDGIIANFDHKVKIIAEKLWPGRVPPGYEPTDWDWTDLFTKGDWDVLWKEIKADPNFWRNSYAYEDNLHHLREFLSNHSKQEVYYITSRSKSTGDPIVIQTRDWLENYGIFSFRAASNYQAIFPVNKPELKRPLIEALGIEYFIDDYGPTVAGLQDLPKTKTFLHDRPWNRDQEYGPRVYSLEQYFKEIENKL